MTPKKLRAFALAAAAFVSTEAAFAQEGLLEIYQRALQNDPTIREAEAVFLATSEVRPQARSNLLPNLTFGGTRSHRFQESTGGAIVPGTGQRFGRSSEFLTTSNSYNVSITQSLFDWSQLSTLRQAEKRVARAETEYELAREQLLLRVGDAYFNVLAAEDTLAAQEGAREAIGRQLEQAQRRFEVGLIAITDVQEAQAGYDEAIAAEINAQRLLASSQETLRAIIGEYVAELAGPGEELPLVTPDPATPEEWVRSALRQNTALVSARLNADIAQDGIQIQRGARLPTLSLSAGYSDARQFQAATIFNEDGTSIENPSVTRPEGYNWSIDVRVPLFTGGFNSSRVQQSVYEHRAALDGVERVQRETERATRDAYLSVIAEISRVRALAQAVQSAATALRANEAGFEVGTRTTVDVLLAQNNLRNAEVTFARSRYDYILNVLRLQQAAGSLSIQSVEQVDSWLEQ